MALTESQIRSRINTLTRENNNYSRTKESYKNSLSYANKLVSNLNSSNNYLNMSNDYLKRYFTINSKTGDGGKVNSTQSSINQIIKKINNTLIPEIKNNIINLERKIAQNTIEINNLKRQLNSIRRV